MLDGPFSAKASLATTKHLTVTADSNVFEPETNKVTSIGWRRQKKLWFVCDGQGRMYARYLDDPIDMIKQLAKLKDAGLLTEEEFQHAKASLLSQLGASEYMLPATRGCRGYPNATHCRL